MKLTKQIIKRFETEQKSWGTKVALSNILWIVASEILRDIEVKKITTSYKKPKAGNIVVKGGVEK